MFCVKTHLKGNKIFSLLQLYDFKIFICDALRDLVSFVQFKKREKHPWRSDTLSKVAG